MAAGDGLSSVMLVITELGAGACVHPSPSFYCQRRRKTPGSDALPTKHGSHRAHWIGWLSEYDGPGYYGRKLSRSRSAEYIYQHLHCAPMVIWLAELAGVDEKLLRLAVREAVPEPELYQDSPSAAARARGILLGS
jgi:hypothetical protein